MFVEFFVSLLLLLLKPVRLVRVSNMHTCVNFACTCVCVGGWITVAYRSSVHRDGEAGREGRKEGDDIGGMDRWPAARPDNITTKNDGRL